MEMQRLRKRLRTAIRGHRLLKDKLDELMKRFLETSREAKRLRAESETALARAYSGYAFARAVMGAEATSVALMIPARFVSVSVGSKNVMGVVVPDFGFHEDNGEATYGYSSTAVGLDGAVSVFSVAAPLLLALARAEKTAQLMALEIERTRRRVNALENIMIPDYSETIRYIVMKLEENDSGSKTRLMKVKEMILTQK
jgi:V/A-type H+-transporting ATPase subunit D